jgi:proteasome lid subunit RPN8/RPN11
MNRASREAALAHAMRDYPKEACGLLIHTGDTTIYHPCKNLADSTEHFILDPKDYADADELGNIVGIFHSHPDSSPEPSESDIEIAESSGIPWYIVSVPKIKWGYTEPKGFTPDLVGREFVYGDTDCYTLIRDYYRIEHNIILNNYDSKDKWWNDGEDFYVKNFEYEGFKQVEASDMQPGDMLFMKILSPVSNHAAIYLGYNTILHHLYGRLSCREIYGDFWRKVTTHVLRYSHEEN